MSPMVVSVSPEQLRKRRKTVLARIGMTESELRSKVASGHPLSSEEWDALEVLDRVAFLLEDHE